MNETWLIVFVAITSVAVLIQMGVMVGIFLSVKKTTAQMEALSAKAMPLLDDAREILTNAKPKIISVTDDLVVASKEIREQSVKLGAVVNDAVDRARLQVIRADQMMTDTLNKVETTTNIVQNSVIGPVKTVGAVVQGVTVALGTYLGRMRQGTRLPDGSEQEEEMFI